MAAGRYHMNDVVRMSPPLQPEAIRRLSVGQGILLSGSIITARDAAHRYLVEAGPHEAPPVDLAGAIIYHCGPVIAGTGDQRRVVSAGPTTSMRMEMYEQRLIEKYRIGAIIGKGGMGPATERALVAVGTVYLAAPSGAGALLARRIKRVVSVWKLEEFGSPEALWQLEVEDFPAVVAIDAKGGSLYREVAEKSRQALSRLLAPAEK